MLKNCSGHCIDVDSGSHLYEYIISFKTSGVVCIEKHL